MLTLEVIVRGTESPEDLRKKGVIPAVFYGPKEKATAVAIDGRSLERVWKQAGETTIITLKGIGKDKDTLIHDVQFHPVTGALLHADFYVLEEGKKIKIDVPLEFIGAAPAEKEGHIITKVMHEIEIEVAPKELPQHLNVDLSTLAKVGDHITADQIALPPSATLITDKHEIVASVTAYVEEKAEIEPAPVTEIIGEKEKAAEAAAEGAAPEGKPEKADKK